ncbi:S53 family peptidase [Nakamurella endophytica]|uniref:Serine protease n=1 Tax=Nakamurella endophytica TaxID=1748367 RepID=A0A917WPA8_9ACTN|nr:S53 family peptidase [Nakamurella endophytica]GGM18291.1 serine protease [Nakamurella endophytica]
MRQLPLRLRAAACAVALLAPLCTALPAAAVEPRVALPGSRPAWAATTQATGTAPAATQTVTVRVVLNLRDAAGAELVARQVSDPRNAAYGRYLTPAAFNARFAPTAVSVRTVTDYLRASGITVGAVAAGNRWISASGSATAMNKAFGTVLKNYLVAGRVLRAPSSAATLPSTVAALVAGVSGLSQAPTSRTPAHLSVPVDRPAGAGRAPATGTVAGTGTGTAKGTAPTATTTAATLAPAALRPAPTTCSEYWGQRTQTLPSAFGTTRFNTYLCGYTPARLRTAYDMAGPVARGQTGKGVTVAIVGAYASPTMLADANRWAARYGEPAFRSGQYLETVSRPFSQQTECGGEATWNGEQTLDVEAVHAMAPGATIRYVGARNCNEGMDEALNWVIQNRAATIVSNSYGYTGEQPGAAEVALQHALFVQAAAEGIGLYFSSGDAGDNVANGLSPQPDFPASDPLVTAVGGTSLLLDQRDRTVAERGWETSAAFVDWSGSSARYTSGLPGGFLFGAGGGTSSVFTQPAYQASVVPDTLSQARGTTRMRVVPDIAAVADPFTGMYVGQTVGGTFTVSTIGGTSLAAPLVAGIQAVASQCRTAPIGFANPLLYSLTRAAFGDVAPAAAVHFASPAAGYVGTFETGDTQRTARGHDAITGLGTPRGSALIAAEAQARPRS